MDLNLPPTKPPPNGNNICTYTVETKVASLCFQRSSNGKNDCIISNHTCPEHHEVVTKHKSKKIMENYSKNKAIKRKVFDFDVTSLQRRPNFPKFLWFRENVAKSVTVQKGKLIALVNYHNTPYDSLIEKGVTFIPNCIDISDDAYGEFKDLVD